MASDDEEALIARLRNAFAENVTSRSEAARIRRSIAAKVNSYLDYEGRSEGVPVRVNSPGKEITGIRRRYLEALKTNLEARERYEQATSSRRRKVPPSHASFSQADIVFIHLELARLEKRHKELDIRRRYVSTLSQDAATLRDLEMPSEQRSVLDVAEGNNEEIASSVARVKSLTSKLRKATLQANHQLERQKMLLARTDQTPTRTGPGRDELQTRARAIAATRNVLVSWLDEKLSAGGDEQTEEDQSGGPDDEVALPGASIADHYQRYLVARKELIEAGKEPVRPLAVSELDSSDSAETPANEQPPTSDDLYLIQAIRTRLVPLLQQQSDSMILQKYSSVQIAKERQDTLGVLERLAEESHLLSTYPTGEIEGKDDLARNLASWISAANASSVSVTSVIEQHHKDGLQALEKAEVELAELKRYQYENETFPKKDEGINWNGIHGRLESSRNS